MGFELRVPLLQLSLFKKGYPLVQSLIQFFVYNNQPFEEME